MADKFDEQAEELLPLGGGMLPFEYRSAVAAALRVNGQRLQDTELKFLDLSYEFQAVKLKLAQAQAEIERLKTIEVWAINLSSS